MLIEKCIDENMNQKWTINPETAIETTVVSFLMDALRKAYSKKDYKLPDLGLGKYKIDDMKMEKL